MNGRLATRIYKSMFFATGVLLSLVTAAIIWFSLMWFVAGSGILQMWTGAHFITYTIGFALSFGLSVSQAEHIPEVIYRVSQFGNKLLFLIPLSTGFRAISDALFPSRPFTLGDVTMNSVEVFTYATAAALVLFLLFAILSRMAEKRVEDG